VALIFSFFCLSFLHGNRLQHDGVFVIGKQLHPLLKISHPVVAAILLFRLIPATFLSLLHVALTRDVLVVEWADQGRLEGLWTSLKNRNMSAFFSHRSAVPLIKPRSLASVIHLQDRVRLIEVLGCRRNRSRIAINPHCAPKTVARSFQRGQILLEGVPCER